MKHLLTQTFITAFLLFGIASAATASTLVGGFYYTFSGTEATVTYKKQGQATDIYKDSLAIPSTIVYSGKTYTVTTIDVFAFYKCTGLTAITIPGTITSIGTSAFNGCTGLSSVTIPNSMTKLGDSAFSGCTSLTTVSIGSGMTSIGGQAFYNCPLTSMKCLAVTPPTLGSDVFKSTAFTLSVPYRSGSLYAADANWGKISSIKEIGSTPATSIAFSKKKKAMLVSKKAVLLPVILPEEASQQSLTWTSDNASIATVDTEGNVTAVAKGSTTITAITTDGSNLSASYTIYVYEPGLPGDVNGDGDITIADANAIVDMFLKE